jgi:tetratricopeptide (TPR) repeat protein
VRLNNIKLELPEIVASSTEHFVGRTWLLPHILNWFDKSDQRIFILRGGPGTGKSSILAWLAGIGPLPSGSGETNARAQLKKIRSRVKAAHFFMSNTGNTAPKAFAEDIAKQLTQNINKFGDALAASLADRVQIIAKTRVGKAQKVTGVYIGKLDLSGLTDEFSFDRVLRDPLKHLYEELGYSETILLLVDALDEALTYRGGTNIVQLLSKLEDLPKQVRILATTRGDPRVLKYFTDIKPFDIIKDAPPEIDDVKSYGSKRLEVTLANEMHHRQILADKVSKAAGGNFLYAYLVIEDLLRHPPNVKEVEKIEFPSGLNALYHEFLNRELGADEDRWYNTFKPLLGLIAASQGGGLTGTQLQEMIGREIEQTLRICKQYLQGALPEGPFRVFHKSFADFLFEEKENIDYHIDAASMHKKIVTYYKGKALSWQDVDWKRVDDYGLQYLATHAYELRSNEVHRQELYGLICKPFMQEKSSRFHSHGSFANDVELAITVALSEEPPNLIQIIRESLIYATLRSLATDVAPETLAALTQLGQFERARDYADLIQDAEKQSQAYRFIADALLSSGQRTSAQLILKQALEAANSIDPIERNHKKAIVLSELAQTILNAGEQEWAAEVAEQAGIAAERTNFEWVKPNVLLKAAHGLVITQRYERAQKLAIKASSLSIKTYEEHKERKAAVLFKTAIILESTHDDYAATKMADKAWAEISKIIDDSKKGRHHRLSYLLELVKSLINVGSFLIDREEAVKFFDWADAIASNWMYADWHKLAALSELSLALINKDMKTQAVDVTRRAVEVVEEIQKRENKFSPNIDDKDEAIVNVVTALASLQNFDKALEIAESVEESETKSAALGSIAQSLISNAKFDEATEILNRALASTDIVFKNIPLHLGVVSSVTQALAKVGMNERAVEVAQRSAEIANHVSEEDIEKHMT